MRFSMNFLSIWFGLQPYPFLGALGTSWHGSTSRPSRLNYVEASVCFRSKCDAEVRDVRVLRLVGLSLDAR